MVKRELQLFVFNGLISVAISFCVYLVLADYGLQLHLASGVSYLAGMAYGFFANKTLTFANKEKLRLDNFLSYFILYSVTLVINIATNFFMLMIFSDFMIRSYLAFFVSISLSTILNFLGLKYFVFSKNLSQID